MDLVREFELFWRASGRAKVTFDTYNTYLRKFQEAGFALPPTLADARQWISDCRDAGVKSQSLLVRVRAIKAFSRFYGEQFDEADPLAKLRFPKADEALSGVVAADADINKVISKLKGRRALIDLRDLAIVVMLRDSWVRRGERCRMILADVDLDHQSIALPRTKSYKGRTS